MLYIKQICLIIYIIITVLFTVGYASQPILEISQTSQPLPNSNNSIKVNSTFYFSKVSNIISFMQDIRSSDNDYSSLDNDLNMLFKTLLYTCISISILLAAGILLGYFGLKFISKIVFLLAMLLMIGVFIVIQVVILSNNFISKIRENGLNKVTGSIGSANDNARTGYYLIFVSTILMVITYAIYVFLA